MACKWVKGAPKVAFITGGGSGLGREFAQILLKQGVSVALMDLKIADDTLADMRAIAGPGQKILACQVDVTDSDAIQMVVRQAVDDLGAPDLAINCAGIGLSRSFRDLSQAEFERVVTVNLFGTRNFAAAVLPHMSRGSHLALIASMAGKVGTFGYGAYAASKFGVVGLAEVLRMEERPRGIDVSVICPGEVATPMVELEAIDMHPIARAVKDLAGAMQPADACAEIMDQLSRRKFVVIPGREARRTAWLARHVPGPLMKTIDKTVARVARERGLN